jgi:hypothetical protein
VYPAVAGVVAAHARVAHGGGHAAAFAEPARGLRSLAAEVRCGGGW